MNDEKISIKFDIQNKENHLNVDYAEEITEYINDCNEIGFFKCFATILAESNEFKCPKKCVTLAFQSMMETIDHNHGLRTSSEEIAFTAWPKTKSQS